MFNMLYNTKQGGNVDSCALGKFSATNLKLKGFLFDLQLTRKFNRLILPILQAFWFDCVRHLFPSTPSLAPGHSRRQSVGVFPGLFDAVCTCSYRSSVLLVLTQVAFFFFLIPQASFCIPQDLFLYQDMLQFSRSRSCVCYPLTYLMRASPIYCMQDRLTLHDRRIF